MPKGCQTAKPLEKVIRQIRYLRHPVHPSMLGVVGSSPTGGGIPRARTAATNLPPKVVAARVGDSLKGPPLSMGA